jgi:hypothetical protein
MEGSQKKGLYVRGKRIHNRKVSTGKQNGRSLLSIGILGMSGNRGMLRSGGTNDKRSQNRHDIGVNKGAGAPR